MTYQPTKETLQTFASYVKDRPARQQITTTELATFLHSKAEAGRLLKHLTLMGVTEYKGGYFLSEEYESVILDIIQHGPVIYPRTPEETLKIYGRIEDVLPAIRIDVDAYGCKIQALPSQRTIPEAKRQIVQGTTLIKPPIELDEINKWILERFLEDISNGNFEFHERDIVIPTDEFYVFSASNIAQTASKPVATLAYLSGDILNHFRKLAKPLISYEQRRDAGLDAYYPEFTDKNFRDDYRRTVEVFVHENSDRIKQELIDKVMSLWCPKSLELEAETSKVEVIIIPTIGRKSRLRSLVKRLFPF